MAEYFAKTIEEAIELGLKELNLEKENADIEILEEPTKGFLGINAKKAKVKVTKKKTDGERAVDFLDELFNKMNLPVTSQLVEEGESIVINLITTNSSSIIGYRGEILDSLQALAGAVANIGREDYKRVVVDCEEYRQKREETLISLANKLAEKAVRTGRKVTLEPMNPYKRRIIHSALAENKTVKTISEGKEPNRYVCIIPEGYKPRDNKNFGNKKVYNKDRNSKFDNGKKYEKRGFDKFAKKEPRPKTKGFGTFIGNSLKDENN